MQYHKGNKISLLCLIIIKLQVAFHLNKTRIIAFNTQFVSHSQAKVVADIFKLTIHKMRGKEMQKCSYSLAETHKLELLNTFHTAYLEYIFDNYYNSFQTKNMYYLSLPISIQLNKAERYF